MKIDIYSYIATSICTVSLNNNSMTIATVIAITRYRNVINIQYPTSARGKGRNNETVTVTGGRIEGDKYRVGLQ